MREPRDPRHPKASETAESVARAEYGGASPPPRRQGPRPQSVRFFSVSATVVSPVSPPVLSQRIEDAICRAVHGVNFPQGPPAAAKVDVGRQRPAAHGLEASGSSRCYFRCYHRNSHHAVFMGFRLWRFHPSPVSAREC